MTSVTLPSPTRPSRVLAALSASANFLFTTIDVIVSVMYLVALMMVVLFAGVHYPLLVLRYTRRSDFQEVGGTVGHIGCVIALISLLLVYLHWAVSAYTVSFENPLLQFALVFVRETSAMTLGAPYGVVTVVLAGLIGYSFLADKDRHHCDQAPH